MPWGLYGVGPDQQEEDTVAKMVQQILGSLEPTPVPPPPQLPPMAGTGARIAGGIGDALLAMSAVRAGGQAPQFGPFAMRQMQTQNQRAALQQKYQETLAEARAADREARNRVRAEGGMIGLRNAGRAANQRAFKSEVNRDIGGETHKIIQFFDANTNELIGEHDAGPVGYAPAILASPEGFQRAPKQGGAATPILSKSGNPIYPTPPAGVVQSVAAGTATMGGLDDLEQAYQKIHDTVSNRPFSKQVIGTYVGESRVGGKLAPEYAEYTASRRAALNAYIKSVTGAQFSVKELERYEGQYPEPWDSPELAHQKIQVLRDRAKADMEAKLRAFPGAGGAAPQTETPVAPQTETPEQKKARIRAKYGLGG
jgi:hypothetical protein